MKDPTALERAFELARSGKYAKVHDIVRQLKAERYSTDQITGRSLVAQLKDLIKDAHQRP